MHTLNTRNLPLLAGLLNWDKDFESPFKSDMTAHKAALAEKGTARHKRLVALRDAAAQLYPLAQAQG